MPERILSDSSLIFSFRVGSLECTSPCLSPFPALRSVDLVDLICSGLHAKSDKTALSVLEVLPRYFRRGYLKLNLLCVSSPLSSSIGSENLRLMSFPC